MPWGLREMESVRGRGGELGPCPPERGKDKQLIPNKGRDNMGKDKEDLPSQV